MMSVQFNDQKFYEFAQKKALAGLKVVGEFVAGEAAKRAPHKSLRLKDSIISKVHESEMFVRISSNMVYAAIQELGGVIKPDKAGALTIPIHPEAKKLVQSGGSAKDVPGLVMIKRKNGPPLLVRIKDKGRNKRFDIMFVLVKSVVIPAHPYLRPAVYENKETISQMFAKAKAV